MKLLRISTLKNVSQRLNYSEPFVFSKHLPSVSATRRQSIQPFPLPAIKSRSLSKHSASLDDNFKDLLMGPLDNIMPRHHFTPKALFIPASNSSKEEILESLKSGLAQTLKAIPSIAGHVKLAPNPVQKGGMCVSAPVNTVDDIFTARDLTESHPEMEYENLKQKHFPMKAVNRNVLYSLPGVTDVEKPVFVAQANFIRGGLVLGVSLHHSFGDGASLKMILRTWAAYCRGDRDEPNLHTSSLRERLTSSEIGVSLSDFPEYTTISDNKIGYKPEVAKGRSAEFATMPPKVDSHVFYLSSQRLKELKALASAKLQQSDWISTSDALSALLWRSITVARNPESDIVPREETRVLGIMVDGRRHMSQDPDSYMGNMILFNNAKAQLQSLLSSPPQLSELAHSIRRSISRIDEKYINRALSAISSAPDVSKVMMTGGTFDESALTITSWGDFRMDWGHVVGGPCERVRVSGIPYSGACVILPASVSGAKTTRMNGVEVLIGLNSDDMIRLMKDDFFTSFAKWRCS